MSDDIEQDMWDKWLFMAAGGAATVLLGRSGRRRLGRPGRLRTVQDVLAEGIAVFEAAGHPARDAAVASTRTTLTTPGSPFTTSMYRDFVAGRGTEVEPILGDLIGLAGDLGVATPPPCSPPPPSASGSTMLRRGDTALQEQRQATATTAVVLIANFMCNLDLWVVNVAVTAIGKDLPGAPSTGCPG